jgi:DNA-binding MurR/RpiR family transcriptional regulator
MVQPHGTAARRTIMSYTLSEAAAACGVNKSTVLRAVKSGRISGTKDEFGAWHVEAAELHRVFPPAASAAASPEALPHHAPPDAATDALVAELRAVIVDLRQDRDEWRDQAKRLALAAPVPAPAPAVDAGGPLYRAWRWMRKAG